MTPASLHVKKPGMALNLLQMLEGRKSFGSRHLFEKASVSINADEHIGVIGPNGAGKSTFFRILTGQDELDEGQLIRSKDLSLGYLSQHDHWQAGETGNQFLERTSRVPLWELKSRGRELQVREETLEKSISSLSGGYRMRIKLLSLLGQSPNLMLLDEPTNYLDLETTLLLERFLQSFDGAFLLISHDREFLRRTTDHTLEIEAGEFTKYSGHIDDYFEQKQLLAEQLAARAASLEEKRRSVMDFVNRFGAKATKAKQAQSRLRQLSKMEVIEIKPVQASAVIRIPTPESTGETTLLVEKLELGYGTGPSILKDVNLRIQREDHIGIVGFNGAGKSTLLKALAGTLTPRSGQIQRGYNAKIAFFHQHVVEALQPQHSVFESLMDAAHPSVGRQEILDLAGSLLFSGADIEKPIRVLSGGECSRVALGRVLLQRASCLILDEPTNHLDFQSVEALTQALARFPGTVITVSHDRSFIQRVATKIIEIKDGRAELYPGTYDEYVWRVQQLLKSMDEASENPQVSPGGESASESKLSWQEKKDLEKRKRNLEKSLQDLERRMQKLEAEVLRLNTAISQESESQKLAQMTQSLSTHSTHILEMETQWIEAGEELERLKTQLV